MRFLLAISLFALLSACIAKTAVGVVTAPVRIVGGGVDALTTSQSEADEKRGREMRKREERIGRLQRDYERYSERCQRGDDRACEESRNSYAEIQSLRSGYY